MESPKTISETQKTLETGWRFEQVSRDARGRAGNWNNSNFGRYRCNNAAISLWLLYPQQLSAFLFHAIIAAWPKTHSIHDTKTSNSRFISIIIVTMFWMHRSSATWNLTGS